MQNEIRIYNEFKNPIVLAENGEAVPYTKCTDRHGREILCFAAVPNEAYRISEK